ncbi:hypothetical protein MVES1_001665 [Malassezia vespertilionis]|uniref:Uncharacterized protein n=1 Tax=Malassezia vespertilionis TaxID=2020962 RepID=A0A2N1JDJ2_9BASI|nr:uncharacterized protein MVES1_001665 [Malassezia vespertilionis]PKI84625.1 hypothetical protein MVES_001567 [Malassezia vespertilionis]WFD06320.1 hypothetical protein MVES1_001665 [Malassezia vespertilionis]
MSGACGQDNRDEGGTWGPKNNAGENARLKLQGGALDANDAMALPETPSTRKASLLGDTMRPAQSTPAPRSGHAPPRSLRRSRLLYISSDDQSSTCDVPSSPVRTNEIAQYQVEELVAAAANPASWSAKEHGGTYLHTAMLHGIAGKERCCMELREALAAEEAHLLALRNAWQRIATHSSAMVPSAPSAYAFARRSAPRSNGTPFSPSSIQAQRTETQSKPAPPSPRKSPQKWAATLAQSNAWPNLTKLPQQLHALVDTFAPIETPAKAMPRNEHDLLGSPTARNVAQALGAQAEEEDVTLSGMGQPSSLLLDSRRSSQSLLKAHIPPQSEDEIPPTPPPKDVDLGESALSEKLVFGWNVFSKRVVETTNSLADRAFHVQESLDSATPLHDYPGASPTKGGSMLGSRSMTRQALEEKTLAHNTTTEAAEKEHVYIRQILRK